MAIHALPSSNPENGGTEFIYHYAFNRSPKITKKKGYKVISDDYLQYSFIILMRLTVRTKYCPKIKKKKGYKVISDDYLQYSCIILMRLTVRTKYSPKIKKKKRSYEMTICYISCPL